MLFAELLTAATAEAAAELEFAGAGAPAGAPSSAGTGELSIIYCIGVCDGSSLNYCMTFLVKKSQKRHQVRSITKLYIHSLYRPKTLGTIVS